MEAFFQGEFMKDNRKTLIARIHIAKKDLGLDDDTYREMLNAATGQTSCKDMHISDLFKVMEHLKQLGYKSKRSGYGKRPNPAQGNKALMSKVEALLADRKLHWNYAHSMAKHMYGVEKVDWLESEQLISVITALTNQAKKKSKK
jgi:phage gp16-like protein